MLSRAVEVIVSGSIASAALPVSASALRVAEPFARLVASETAPTASSALSRAARAVRSALPWWCEFCWSVRKLFKATGIAFRSVDLDSVAYQEDNLGGRIRVALRHITHAQTIPQIFVAGRHIGGATELFDAFNDGSLQEMLSSAGIAFDDARVRDAYSFLPNWLHPR
jgi:cysteine synthase